MSVKQQLIENGFAVIPRFITRVRALNLFKDYQSCSVIEGRQDNQVKEASHVIVNFRPFVKLLCEQIPVVSNFVEEFVLPTYTYARIYRHGNVLERHTDRPACEISLTVHLNGDQPWPIFMETPRGEQVPVNLEPGDAAIYLGCDTPHWREAYTGQEYGQVFLHYVLSDGIFWDEHFNLKHLVEHMANKKEKEHGNSFKNV